jgi:membrane protein insertase Oxa1/YidC/SpoIIIJ
MQAVSAKQAEIQAKYAGKKDPASKQKQQMETMELYKREGISPFSAIIASLLLQLRKQRGQLLSAQQKKSRRRQFIMQGVFAVVFIFIVATVASGVAVY